MAQKPVPYLQTPTSTSIWVNWRTEASIDSKVYYGLAEDELTNLASGTTQDLKDPGDNYLKNYYYHSVKLTGLQADTRYYYKTVSDDIESDVYSFRTQPEEGSQGVYRFLILGDHQLFDDRYERLMKAAKAVCESKYGTPIENYISLITNVGDQVDMGTLTHYEQVHFGKSETLSPSLPIMTIVGNHETYGTLGLNAYSNHFHYDEIEYSGISSGSEFYYAFQAGRALFLMMSSEQVHTNNAQLTWISNVIEAAKEDPNIDWIFSYNHRPLQAEQYIGDVSPWVRDKVMPLLNTTEKSVMNVSGHHHLYHRGQLRDYPTYHIITGGAAWDQRWGQSTEKDFDDVQKTIDYWPFQIVELNSEARSMQVETYVIGNQVETLDAPVLVDTFSRIFNQPKPEKPSIQPLETSNTIELPYTFESSPYSTTSGIGYNSVQFQVAASNDFAKLEFDLIRDFENIYGAHPASCELVDINRDVNIFRQTIDKSQLFNGRHYIRVRHRDKNVEWSEWSDTVAFETIGGLDGETTITPNKKVYAAGETISFSFANATNLEGQWIGIYGEVQTPSSLSPSVAWENASGGAGLVAFTLTTPGVYYAALFKDGNYDQLARTDLFYVGAVPILSADKPKYEVGEAIKIHVSNAPELANDWIGIYKMGDTPGPIPSTAWSYITAVLNDTLTIQSENLKKGYYFISYLMQDHYFESSERIYIQIGEEISSLSLLQDSIEANEPVVFLFENGPGTPKDYVGIYKEGDVYGVDELTHYLYVNGEISGQVAWENHQLPEGNYYAYLFTNDSYDAVSNKVEFTVKAADELPGDATITSLSLSKSTFEPNEGIVFRFENGSGMPGDYVGIYKNGDVYGVDTLTDSLEIEGTSGEVAWEHHLPEGNYYAYLFANDSYDTVSNKVEFTVLATPATSVPFSPSPSGLQVYPNPASDNLTITVQDNSTIEKVDIYEMSGRMVTTITPVSNKVIVDTQSLPAGVYIVRIHSKETMLSRKVIIR
ncbi:MAG: fibronectin type III domain-containing protein [Prevotellaceae bacterium]|nr:fibronectin type III domain-containing protein [Prevotellaceae bacterium]